MQGLPQAPQLALLDCRSVQVPAQSCVPSGQAEPAAQAPETQACWVLQVTPQLPQLSGSVRVDTQTPLQSCWFSPQLLPEVTPEDPADELPDALVPAPVVLPLALPVLAVPLVLLAAPVVPAALEPLQAATAETSTTEGSRQTVRKRMAFLRKTTFRILPERGGLKPTIPPAILGD